MSISYIALNACTPDVSFPIPNILQLFIRMETKKPTIFGFMDLTVMNSGITLTWRSLEVEEGRFLAKNAYISCQSCAN